MSTLLIAMFSFSAIHAANEKKAQVAFSDQEKAQLQSYAQQSRDMYQGLKTIADNHKGTQVGKFLKDIAATYEKHAQALEKTTQKGAYLKDIAAAYEKHEGDDSQVDYARLADSLKEPSYYR